MIPPVLNTKIIDEVVSVTEGQAIGAMTELMLLCGYLAYWQRPVARRAAGRCP